MDGERRVIRPGYRIELPRDVGASMVAREALEHVRDEVDPDQLAAARVALSELANNALLHGNGAIVAEISLDERTLRAEVTDEGRGFVAELGRVGEAGGGWGLQIVGAFADRWGVLEGESTVWFELERWPDPRGRGSGQAVA